MKRRRLEVGEVHCAECKRPMLEAAAVTFNEQKLHPEGCFAKVLKRWKRTVNDRLEKHLGTVDFSLSLGTVSAETAYRMGRESADALGLAPALELARRGKAAR